MSKRDKPDVEELVKALYGLGRVRREISRHALAELGTQGFNALAIVHKNGPMRVSDVAHRLGVDVSVASRQLSALIDGGYAEREPSSEDGRAWLVKTTGDGHRVLKESHRRMVHAFGELLGDWSADDVDALSSALNRLSDDFSRESAPTEREEVAR
jgi:DNA-binding MarR family transcriptional regulator